MIDYCAKYRVNGMVYQAVDSMTQIKLPGKLPGTTTYSNKFTQLRSLIGHFIIQLRLATLRAIAEAALQSACLLNNTLTVTKN